MKNCCNNLANKIKKCKRNDNKIFSLPRRFSKKQCLSNKIKGFSMRSSCVPYKFCKTNKRHRQIGSSKTKKQFLYNPDDPARSFDVYIDKNPKDTISIKYKTISDVKNTIKKLEKLYKNDKYSHKRIWQVGMIMYVRLKVLKDKKKKEFKLSEKYFKFLKNRTKKNQIERTKLKFKL
jgi:hypothetical protein